MKFLHFYELAIYESSVSKRIKLFLKRLQHFHFCIGNLGFNHCSNVLFIRLCRSIYLLVVERRPPVTSRDQVLIVFFLCKYAINFVQLAVTGLWPRTIVMRVQPGIVRTLLWHTISHCRMSPIAAEGIKDRSSFDSGRISIRCFTIVST